MRKLLNSFFLIMREKVVKVVVMKERVEKVIEWLLIMRRLFLGLSYTIKKLICRINSFIMQKKLVEWFIDMIILLSELEEICH